MDADWSGRLSYLTKRYQPGLQSRSDLFLGLEEIDGDDDTREEYPCPFCCEYFDIVGLCCHIDDEHPVEAKNGVCPVCATKVGIDMVAHITLQHGNIFKMQRKRKSYKGGSHSTLALLRKELREGNLQSLFGGSSYIVSPNNADPDPLSSFILPMCDELVNSECNSSSDTIFPNKGKDEKSLERNMQSPPLSIKDQKERAKRPLDLLPDDTTLIYDKNGNPVDEKDFDDPDDENLENSRKIKRCSDLALAYYNGKHHTDYKHVVCTHLETTYGDSILIHFGFIAFPSTASEKCDYAAAKQFCTKLEAQGCSVGEEAVTSCRIVDGPKVCEDCYDDMRVFLRNVGKTSRDEEPNRTKSKEIVPPLSKYSHLLADGVTLSDKAKLRLRFILLALAYYNKKQHADYKLVDGLPRCFSCETSYGIVYHGNFIARQNKSDKLFFAELTKPGDDWVVTSCRIVHGKTTAGCHVCPSHLGKRVIHPSRGFRFGLYPAGCRSSLRGRH